MSQETQPKTHHLKTDPVPFAKSASGEKLFEVRKNDRDFQVGDLIVLQETKWDANYMIHHYAPLEYTGRELTFRVKYILAGGYGLHDGYVCLGLETLPSCLPTQDRCPIYEVMP